MANYAGAFAGALAGSAMKTWEAMNAEDRAKAAEARANEQFGWQRDDRQRQKEIEAELGKVGNVGDVVTDRWLHPETGAELDDKGRQAYVADKYKTAMGGADTPDAAELGTRAAYDAHSAFVPRPRKLTDADIAERTAAVYNKYGQRDKAIEMQLKSYQLKGAKRTDAEEDAVAEAMKSAQDQFKLLKEAGPAEWAKNFAVQYNQNQGHHADGYQMVVVDVGGKPGVQLLKDGKPDPARPPVELTEDLARKTILKDYEHRIRTINPKYMQQGVENDRANRKLGIEEAAQQEGVRHNKASEKVAEDKLVIERAHVDFMNEHWKRMDARAREEMSLRIKDMNDRLKGQFEPVGLTEDGQPLTYNKKTNELRILDGTPTGKAATGVQVQQFFKKFSGEKNGWTMANDGSRRWNEKTGEVQEYVPGVPAKEGWFSRTDAVPPSYKTVPGTGKAIGGDQSAAPRAGLPQPGQNLFGSPQPKQATGIPVAGAPVSSNVPMQKLNSLDSAISALQNSAQSITIRMSREGPNPSEELLRDFKMVTDRIGELQKERASVYKNEIEGR